MQASTLALTVEVPNRSACFDANLRLQIYHNKNFRRNSYLNSLDANFYTETITTGLTPSLRELCYISSQKNYMLDHSRNLGMMCRAGTTSMKYILILKYNSEKLSLRNYFSNESAPQNACTGQLVFKARLKPLRLGALDQVENCFNNLL